jgi:Flp pilus assembly pilin Flp
MLTDDGGASLVEYALVLVFIAIVAIAAMNAFGGSTSSVLSSAALSI